MKKRWIICIALLLAFMLPFSVLADGTAVKSSRNPLSFSTKTLYGKSFSSSCFSGYDLIFINFWAEWCGPCVGELPDLQKIHKNYKNVLVIGAYVSYDNDAAIETAESCGVSYPLISTADVLQLYDYLTIYDDGSFSIPQTCLFDNRGYQIGESYVGSRSYDSWASIVEDALSNLAEETDTVSAVISGIKYDLDIQARTATVTGAKDKKTAKITIPSSVKYDGKKYTVTAIAPNAFKKYTKLSSLEIGKNIVSIGTSAFNGCKNLKNLTIKTKKLTAESVGKNAFKSIYKKAVVKCPSGLAGSYKTILVKAGAPKTIKCK